MNLTLKKQLFRTFVQMIADLEDNKEIEKFLTDFFSEEELEIYIKRISTAYWLKKGRDEKNITQNLHTSSEDVKKIRTLMKKEGFKLALNKMEAEEWADVWSEKINKFRLRR